MARAAPRHVSSPDSLLLFALLGWSVLASGKGAAAGRCQRRDSPRRHAQSRPRGRRSWALSPFPAHVLTLAETQAAPSNQNTIKAFNSRQVVLMR